MDEPKKALLEAAARQRWPKLTGIYINHRKHTMRVTFGKARRHPDDFELSGRSHRELLTMLQA